MRNALIQTTLYIIILLAIDRVGKILMETYLAGRDMVVVIPGVVGFRLLHKGNTGAAFGILSNHTWVLVVLTSILILGMLYILYVKKLNSKFLHFCLILVTAGGLGNLYDRIVYGSVTDFIEFLFMQFAVFNFADCFVSIGAFLAILYLIFFFKDQPIFAAGKKLEPTDNE